MPTPHNSARIGEIAETILLPGDPLRAGMIAETYLSDARQVTNVRNMLGFTGTYKGIPLSVMGTGMGCASMGIYSYELIHEYGVRNLIRLGSCGAFSENVNIGDLIMAMGASSDTNYAAQYELNGNFAATASFDLLTKAVSSAEHLQVPYHVGTVFTTDVFYRRKGATKHWEEMGILAAEMETFALYCNAASAGVNALAILTVSDNLAEDRHISTEKRERGLTDMAEVALETALLTTTKEKNHV